MAFCRQTLLQSGCSAASGPWPVWRLMACRAWRVLRGCETARWRSGRPGRPTRNERVCAARLLRVGVPRRVYALRESPTVVLIGTPSMSAAIPHPFLPRVMPFEPNQRCLTVGCLHLQALLPSTLPTAAYAGCRLDPLTLQTRGLCLWGMRMCRTVGAYGLLHVFKGSTAVTLSLPSASHMGMWWADTCCMSKWAPFLGPSDPWQSPVGLPPQAAQARATQRDTWSQLSPQPCSVSTGKSGQPACWRGLGSWVQIPYRHAR